MNYSLMCFPEFKKKTVTLSYDDGTVFDEKLIEIMSKYGMKGTFNIPSTFFAKEEGGRHLTAEKTYEIITKSNNEIAIHGSEHLLIPAMDSAIAANDVISDRIVLEKLFGRIIKGMAYANGNFDDRAVDILKNCGIKYARTTLSTNEFDFPDNWLKLHPTCHHISPNLMQLAKRFVEIEENPYFWGNPARMFYLWGHSYEFNDNNNWNVIEEFCKYMGNRPDIWYATNGEIYDYVKAFEALEFSVEARFVYNPTVIDVYLDYLGDKHIIHSGETVKLK